MTFLHNFLDTIHKNVSAVENDWYQAKIHLDTRSFICSNRLHYYKATLFYPTENFYPCSVSYSNGTAVPAKMTCQLLQILTDCRIVIPWKQGDVQIHSSSHFHGKCAHDGKQKVLVAMHKT